MRRRTAPRRRTHDAGALNFASYSAFSRAQFEMLKPRAVVMKLSAETRRVLETPEVAARLAKAGIAPYWSSPEDMAALIRRNAERFAALVRAIGIQPE